jgi:polyisoprenoid-binding protein YceI
MSRRNVLMIIGVLALMGISSVVSVLVYNQVIGGSGEPDVPITAPTLSLATATPNPLQAQVEALSSQVAALQAQNATLVAGGSSSGTEATQPPAVETTTDPSPAAETTETSAANPTAATLFRISQDESTVSFTITEELFGKPNTVVGTTNQVAGDILVDFGTPANSRVGVIRIDARNLATDSEFRNRAIRTAILESRLDEYQFVEFTPTAITGLPDTVQIGQVVTFQIAGDLKIRDIVQPVTFDVTATVASEDRLVGNATTHVTREQYNLTIPNAPGVANVADDVELKIDFVATKVAQ